MDRLTPDELRRISVEMFGPGVQYMVGIQDFIKAVADRLSTGAATRDEVLEEACAVIAARMAGNKDFANRHAAHSPTWNQWVNAALECEILLQHIRALKSASPSGRISAPPDTSAAPTQMAAEREALAKWFFEHNDFKFETRWADADPILKPLWYVKADALLSSGIVTKVPTHKEIMAALVEHPCDYYAMQDEVADSILALLRPQARGGE